MKTRTASPRRFCFDNEQKQALLKKLGKQGDQARAFIADVADHLHHFKTADADRRSRPTPTKAAVKKRLAKLQVATCTLHDMLRAVDPHDDSLELVEMLSTLIALREDFPDVANLEADEDFDSYLARTRVLEIEAEQHLSRMTADLKTFREAIEHALKYRRNSKRGRPHLKHEVLLLEAIARSYRTRFGRLPAANSRGKFHKFIVIAMGYADLQQNSWYRPLKVAIERAEHSPDYDLIR